MVPPASAAPLRELLADHAYFGLQAEQVGGRVLAACGCRHVPRGALCGWSRLSSTLTSLALRECSNGTEGLRRVIAYWHDRC